MLNCSDQSDYGLASLSEHHAIRIRDGDVLTSKENGYWHYLFDIMLNGQLNRSSSKMVFKRGVEFLLEQDQHNNHRSQCSGESKLPMDEAEATRRVKELACLLKKGKWTYFITLTVNESETPGIREITRAIHDFADGDDDKVSDLVDAYLPFLLRSWERFVRVLLQELIMRNNAIIGKVKDMFYRFEFQGAGAKGNKPHVHAGVTLEPESEKDSVDRICCSSLEFGSSLCKTDFESLLGLGIVNDELEYEKWLEIVSFVNTHDCQRAGGRCMKATNAQGEKTCRYHRQSPLPIEEVGGWFEPIEVQYSDELYALLEEMELARRQYDAFEECNKWILHKSLSAGKWHYRARADEFFIASIPLLSAITRSATNVDKCDRRFQTSYLVKYISGKEEHQLVDVAGSKDIDEVKVTTEEHAHEKITTCRKIGESKEKIRPHLGREMSLAEVVWFVLGFPYTHCTADFVHVPTLPLENRAAVLRFFKPPAMTGTTADERRTAGLPSWRQFTATQEAHMEECIKSSFSIDTTSAFNIRPPELVVFNDLQLYNECFVTRRDRKQHRRPNVELAAEAWTDGSGYVVQIWSCSVDKCVNFLLANLVSGNAFVRQLLDDVFLPIQRGCAVLRKRFVRDTNASQIVAVVSTVKPWDKTKFMTHLCLSQGKYVTELDLFATGNIKEAFVTAGLLPSRNVVDRKDVLLILRRYILSDLAFHPITCRQFSKYAIAASRTMMEVVLQDTAGSYTPCVSEIMLKEQATQQLLQCESLRKSNLIQGLLDDPAVAASLPAHIRDATPDQPLQWEPTISPADGISSAAVAEQSEALAVCKRAIQCFFKSGLLRRQISVFGWSSRQRKITCFEIGLRVLLEQRLASGAHVIHERARAKKLGGNHLHLVFALAVAKGGVTVSSEIAHDCLKNLENDPMKKLLITRTDVFFFEEIGLLSAQIFCALDSVLQILINNLLPWGGKLLISSGDAKQLPPVSGQPIWSSVHMCTVMAVVVFNTDVRARDVHLRWLNDQRRRQLTLAEAIAVADIVLAHCRFVPEWIDVPDSAVRIVSIRAAENDTMEQFLSSKATTEYAAIDEVQNSSDWMAADNIISKRINRACYEYQRCRRFVGAVVRMTYNERSV
jgi:hypothetical protein